VNGLCPAGWLNEQSITKHWFQSIRTFPYSWATGRNSNLYTYTRREHKMFGGRVIFWLKKSGLAKATLDSQRAISAMNLTVQRMSFFT